MAAVKSQRGGPRKETTFTATKCGGCGGALDALRDAWRVRQIIFTGARRQQRWSWHHRGCVK